MTNMETRPTAQEMQDEVVDLHQRKNWPDPRESWFMKDGVGPVCIVSTATSGINRLGEGDKRELAGGMSPNWGQPFDTRVDLGAVSVAELNLTPAELKQVSDEKRQAIQEMRAQAAGQQLDRFLESVGGPQLADDVIILKPQTDHYADRTKVGRIVNADEIARTGEYIEDERPAFMIYSHDPNRVVGIRPADCPTVGFSGRDRSGNEVHGLMHGGWQDEDAGFIDQGLTFLGTDLDADLETFRFHIAAGGVEFGYSRPSDPRDGQDEKFVHPGWKTRVTDVKTTDKGKRFVIDMQGFAVDRLQEAGVTGEQIFIDTSDTTDPKTGYSSHKLFSRGELPPMRDLVLIMTPERASQLNPQLGKMPE